MNIIIEWIAMKDVKVRHEYTPMPKTAKRKYKLFSAHKPHMELYRKSNGEFFLKNGVDAYNTFMTMDPNERIPVFIIDKNIETIDWTFRLLHSCLTENVYFKMKYEYVMLSLEETDNDINKICSKVGCFKEDIEKYIIDPRVPDKYKELAIRHERHTLINKIYRDQRLEGYKLLLYEAAFQENNRLTQKELKTFIKYIQAGHSLNPESPHALSQLSRIVDEKRAFKNHWNFLMTNDPLFNNS